MKKNNKELLDAIVNSLKNGNGRVSTCRMVGIAFETFCDWTNPDSPRFLSDFSERIKKAEGVGKLKIKETCEQVILRAAIDNNKPVWQAAAWMLERKFKNEYALKSEFDHSSSDGTMSPKTSIIVTDSKTKEELEKLMND